MPRRKEPKIPDAILDQLLAGADPKTAFDPNGLLEELKKALAERALNAEVDHHHLASEEADNRRNGYGRKTVVTDTGKTELEVPRGRLQEEPEGAASPASTTRSSRCTPGA
jgi:putative transposase